MLFSLLSLLVLPILGLFTWLFLRRVLHFRAWFIAVLVLGAGLLLHFATLSVLSSVCLLGLSFLGMS